MWTAITQIAIVAMGLLTLVLIVRAIDKVGKEREHKRRYWKLWLDDDLDNPDAPERWTPPGFKGAATSEEAIELVKQHGFLYLEFMDLDHDLGVDEDDKERTAKTFLKWLANDCGLPGYPPPKWNVHSRNPEGKRWIESYLDSWKRSLEK